MNIPFDILTSVGLNIAALVVVLAVFWWRMNRIEARMQEHKEEHRELAATVGGHGVRLGMLDHRTED